MSGDRKRGFLRPEEDNTVAQPQKWGLPDYTSDVSIQAKETAFNYDPGWMPTVEEAIEEEELILTEEQIELIKQGAYQEGLHQGQEAGFKQGYEKGKEEGFAAGHAEGMKSESSKVSPLVKSIFNNKLLFLWGSRINLLNL